MFLSQLKSESDSIFLPRLSLWTDIFIKISVIPGLRCLWLPVAHSSVSPVPGWSPAEQSNHSPRAHLSWLWAAQDVEGGEGTSLLLMEDSRPGSVEQRRHQPTMSTSDWLTSDCPANMTIEETMLRQAEFYNLNASMQEQSKVGHCELSYEEFKEMWFTSGLNLTWSWQSLPWELFPPLIPLLLTLPLPAPQLITSTRSFSRLNTSTLSLTNSVGSVMNPLPASTSEPSPARAVSLSLAGLVTIRLVVTITTSLYSF